MALFGASPPAACAHFRSAELRPIHTHMQAACRPSDQSHRDHRGGLRRGRFDAAAETDIRKDAFAEFSADEWLGEFEVKRCPRHFVHFAGTEVCMYCAGGSGWS